MKLTNNIIEKEVVVFLEKLKKKRKLEEFSIQNKIAINVLITKE